MNGKFCAKFNSDPSFFSVRIHYSFFSSQQDLHSGYQRAAKTKSAEYFANNFGEVKDVQMDWKPPTAVVCFSAAETVTKVLKNPSHTIGSVEIFTKAYKVGQAQSRGHDIRTDATSLDQFAESGKIP